MKNATSTGIIALAVVGVISLSVLAQSGSSHPSHSNSLNAHLTEVTLSVGPGETSAPIPLPVVNRLVHVAFTYTFDNGDVKSTEAAATATTNPGFEGLMWQQGNNYSPGDLDGAVYTLSPGPNGTFTVRNRYDIGDGAFVGGTVHIAMWY